MDVVDPKLVWIEDRCYRFGDETAWSHDHRDLGTYQEEDYEPDYALDEDSLQCGEDYIEIETTKGDRLKHSFYVNSYFYKFIIGSKGMTLKRLAKDTNTVISVPRMGDKGDVGTKRRDIITARHRLDILIETSRSKLEFTHFISIPCNLEEVKQNFCKFKQEILTRFGKGPRAIREELFQKPEKLHLTIIMLVLLDKEDRKKATETLRQCRENILMPAIRSKGSLTIELRGVEIMNDDPSEVDVLYIKAHCDSSCLQNLTDEIVDVFVKQGLTRKQFDNVKLHLTVMNTKFLKSEKERKTRIPGNLKETFDASNILKEFQDYYFGKVQLSEIFLCQRHKQEKDGHYAVTTKIQLQE